MLPNNQSISTPLKKKISFKKPLNCCCQLTMTTSDLPRTLTVTFLVIGVSLDELLSKCNFMAYNIKVYVIYVVLPLVAL